MVSPAGRPSTIATSACPWDSPAVRKRSINTRFYTPRRRAFVVPACVHGDLARRFREPFASSAPISREIREPMLASRLLDGMA